MRVKWDVYLVHVLKFFISPSLNHDNHKEPYKSKYRYKNKYKNSNK